MVWERVGLGVCRSGGIMLMHDDEGGEPEPQRGPAATMTLQQLLSIGNELCEIRLTARLGILTK